MTDRVELALPANSMVSGAGPAQAYAAAGTYVFDLPPGSVVTLTISRGVWPSEGADDDLVEATIYCGSTYPGPGREDCSLPDGHRGWHRSDKTCRAWPYTAEELGRGATP